MIGNKKKVRGFVYGVLIAVCFVPAGQAVNATTSGQSLDAYSAYPTPAAKPFLCVKKEMHDEMYINEKQAAATALGLYLGLRQATAPQQKAKVNNSCV